MLRASSLGIDRSDADQLPLWMLILTYAQRRQAQASLDVEVGDPFGGLGCQDRWALH